MDEVDFCHIVSKGRDIDEINRQLHADPELAHARDPEGTPVLLLAVEGERPIITRMLVRYGADPIATPTAAGREHETPLGTSLRMNRPFITRLLVERFMRQEYF